MALDVERDRARLRVSLVATVLNEFGSIPRWFEGLRGQTRYPDECIIVDGGSDDGTIEALLSEASQLPFPLRVLSRPGAGISKGRNIAIEAARGDIVVVTDAGTSADPIWLERLVQPLEKDDRVDITAGFFRAAAHDGWGRALAATTLPDVTEIDDRNFLPSSRSLAFRRRWFEGGFRYPEWLDYCEDVVFDLQLRRAGAVQVFEPQATVAFQPRRGPVPFFRQYYRYARGDGKAGLFAKRHAVRCATYLAATVILMRFRRNELAITIALAIAYIWPCVRRYRKWYPAPGTRSRQGVTAVGLIVAQRLIGDIAKLAGYPAGLAWRLRRDRSVRFWSTGWINRDEAGDLRRF